MQCTTNSKSVKYFMKDSPNHIRLHLKELREQNDSSCDLDLVIADGSTESVHMVVAQSFSKNIKELCSGRCLDMTSFNAECVRNIIDWIYNGEIELPVSDLADYLIICHHLGMKYLHRQLEQTVRRMAKDKDDFLLALKTATNRATGISDDTIRQCVNAVCDRTEIMNSERLQQFNMDSILALVSGKVIQAQKMALINTALNWLRLPDNMAYCDEVIAAISVKELRPAELDHFKKTLTEVLRNPATCEKVGIEMKLSVTVEAREKKDSTSGEAVVEGERRVNIEGSDDGLSDEKDDVILGSDTELGEQADIDALMGQSMIVHHHVHLVNNGGIVQQLRNNRGWMYANQVNHLYQAAPIANPAAPIANPAAPIANPVAPIANPVAPIANPVAPIANPLVPIANPVAPIANPLVPIANQPAAPIANPLVPIANQPAAPIANPLVPIANQPAAPIAPMQRQ